MEQGPGDQVDYTATEASGKVGAFSAEAGLLVYALAEVAVKGNAEGGGLLGSSLSPEETCGDECRCVCCLLKAILDKKEKYNLIILFLK